MRYLDEALTRITLKKNVESDIAHLFTIGEYYCKTVKISTLRSMRITII